MLKELFLQHSIYKAAFSYGKQQETISQHWTYYRGLQEYKVLPDLSWEALVEKDNRYPWPHSQKHSAGCDGITKNNATQKITFYCFLKSSHYAFKFYLLFQPVAISLAANVIVRLRLGSSRNWWAKKKKSVHPFFLFTIPKRKTALDKQGWKGKLLAFVSSSFVPKAFGGCITVHIEQMGIFLSLLSLNGHGDHMVASTNTTFLRTLSCTSNIISSYFGILNSRK